MALTTTTVINGATVGSSASDASNLSKVTLAAGTTTFSIEAALTAGAASEPSIVLRVRYASSPANLTPTAEEARSLAGTAGTIELRPIEANKTTRRSIPLEGVRGGYLYIWTEEPVFGAAGSLTVISVEA